jgi:hypothetical protein
MGSNRFEAPVRIYMGLNVARDFISPLQAYAFLNDLECDRTRAEYVAAKTACLQALRGDADVQTACDAFAEFADRMGILVPRWDDMAAKPMNATISAQIAA